MVRARSYGTGYDLTTAALAWRVLETRYALSANCPYYGRVIASDPQDANLLPRGVYAR